MSGIFWDWMLEMDAQVLTNSSESVNHAMTRYTHFKK